MENSRKKNETLVYGVLIFLIIFLPFNRANAQVCTPPPANLVSWWPGDGNFADIQDANDGASAGGVTFTAGKVGQAFSFNGAFNSFITLPNNQNFVPTGNTFTIDAWIKPDFSQQNVIDTVLTKRDGCGNFGISHILHVIKFDPAVGGGHDGRPIGQLTLAMTDSSGSPNIEADSGTTVVPNDGQFHHVAGTYDALTMKVYLDGQLVGQAERTGPILATTSAPVISHHGGTCLTRSAAIMDEIGFYDSALSASEIQDIFDAGNAGMCKPLTILERIEDLESQVEALLNHTHSYRTGKGKQHNDTEAVTGPANLE